MTIQMTEIDFSELAVRLCEANYGIPRPAHLTAAEALAAMEPECRDAWKRSAQAVIAYLMECIASSTTTIRTN